MSVYLFRQTPFIPSKISKGKYKRPPAGFYRGGLLYFNRIPVRIILLEFQNPYSVKQNKSYDKG